MGNLKEQSVAYPVLLEKYVKYIMGCEGSDFIHIHNERHMSYVEFTDKEWDVLKEISKRCNYKNEI